MTPEQARHCGETAKAISFTDTELEQQMSVLEIVINYLAGRGDADIVCSALMADVRQFQGFQDARKEQSRQISKLIASLKMGDDCPYFDGNTATVFNQITKQTRMYVWKENQIGISDWVLAE
jgi:hypothetical protein